MTISDTTNSSQPVASIHGQVYSSSGTQLNGATVTCNDVVTTTLADGIYRFSNIPLNTYVLTVTLQGYQSTTQTLTITEAKAYTLDFQLTQATGTSRIVGHVFDSETRRPLTTGTSILILPISNQYSTISPEGTFAFTKLPADRYKLIISIPEYHDCEQEVVLAQGETKVQNIYCLKNREVEPAWG
jgi:hypothetical protein